MPTTDEDLLVKKEMAQFMAFKKQLERYKDGLFAWCDRASKAEQENNSVLARQALEKCWRLQQTVCLSTGVKRPTKPSSPQDVLDWIARRGVERPKLDPDPPGDPFQGRVPRRPLPM